MTKKVIIAIAVVALALVFVPVVFAATTGTNATGAAPGTNGPAGESPFAGRRVKMMQRQLGLTPEQVQKIQDLMSQFRTDNQSLLTQLRDLGSQIRDLRKDPKADPAQLGAKIQELDRTRATLQEKAQALRDAIKGVLTPDQVSKLENSWFGRFMGQGGPRSGRGFGNGGFGCGRGHGWGHIGGWFGNGGANGSNSGSNGSEGGGD